MEYFLAAVILLVLLYFFFVRILPLLIRRAFRGGLEEAPDDYRERTRQIAVLENLSYPSAYPQATFDLYKNPAVQDAPVVFWVHGGAYVGGDKTDNYRYLTLLAAEGFHVVNLNYARAPEAQYPAPLEQLRDAYLFLQSSQQEFALDLDRVFFAGDSAGAQLLSQFINTQINAGYAENQPIDAVIPPQTIKGVLFFCGIFDLETLNRRGNKLIRFLFDKIGRVYFGRRDWKETEELEQIPIIGAVTRDFPPTFITDGNHLSFDEHGKSLGRELEKAGVPVTTVFFDETDKKLDHEYQFKMNTPEAQHTFKEVVGFLKRYSEENQTEKKEESHDQL